MQTSHKGYLFDSRGMSGYLFQAKKTPAKQGV